MTCLYPAKFLYQLSCQHQHLATSPLLLADLQLLVWLCQHSSLGLADWSNTDWNGIIYLSLKQKEPLNRCEGCVYLSQPLQLLNEVITEEQKLGKIPAQVTNQWILETQIRLMLFISLSWEITGDKFCIVYRSTYLSAPFFWYACRQPGHCFECIVPLSKNIQKGKSPPLA